MGRIAVIKISRNFPSRHGSRFRGTSPPGGPDRIPRFESPYLNLSLPIDQRVEDLVSRVTLEEQASQLVNQARAIPRLQVPAYNYWSEALHGIVAAGTGHRLSTSHRSRGNLGCTSAARGGYCLQHRGASEIP